MSSRRTQELSDAFVLKYVEQADPGFIATLLALPNHVLELWRGIEGFRVAYLRDMERMDLAWPSGPITNGEAVSWWPSNLGCEVRERLFAAGWRLVDGTEDATTLDDVDRMFAREARSRWPVRRLKVPWARKGKR